jgi:hypothetical protein
MQVRLDCPAQDQYYIAVGRRGWLALTCVLSQQLCYLATQRGKAVGTLVPVGHYINILWGRARPVREADNLTAIYEPTV